ncbi:DUF7309 domain-containing protein [Paenibacillus popilliae]|uniref:Uncharacterized protein n=1 Tax=Paenibacillus popilliae ATCC 14706 TaxID=1212764 RepID=M9L9S5_PAEPP|nr:hypothetical protein [Paenibacillus popilliae]GAC42232.1 hypothetical protein PPOP_1589 [Paenibacillus popilliae ATCC 14706]
MDRGALAAERSEEEVELSEEQAEWRRLYEAAVAFKKQESWKWMPDFEIFGVCNPEDGEAGYCTIMGSSEELFGLAVFCGGEGLESLQNMMLERDDGYAWLNRQKCMMVTFEDRTDLDKQDLAQIKELGFRFRGHNAWPLFRAYAPGLVPWTLDRKQVCFLTNALEQAAELAARCKKDEQLLVPPVSGQRLVRAQENGEWSEGWRDPEFVLKRPAKYEYSDDAKLANLVCRIPEKRGQWETDYFFAPVAVQGEAERPYYPRLCLWVDRQTRSAVGFHVAYEGNFEQEFIMQRNVRSNELEQATLEQADSRSRQNGACRPCHNERKNRRCLQSRHYRRGCRDCGRHHSRHRRQL